MFFVGVSVSDFLDFLGMGDYSMEVRFWNYMYSGDTYLINRIAYTSPELLFFPFFKKFVFSVYPEEFLTPQ